MPYHQIGKIPKLSTSVCGRSAPILNPVCWRSLAIPFSPSDKDFSYCSFGRLADCFASLVSQGWAMEIAPSLRLDSAGRLIVLRKLERLRKWELLNDRGFCQGCRKFISGRQIKVTSPSGEPLHLVCPTTDCSTTVRNWVYPNEIAQPPDALGRRVLRVIDKSGETSIACEKSYSWRLTSGSMTGL